MTFLLQIGRYRAELTRNSCSQVRQEISIPNRNGLNKAFELRNERERAGVQDSLIAVEFLDGAIVRPPPHPFRFRRKIPVIRIEVANRTQAGFDFCLPLMRPVLAAKKL